MTARTEWGHPAVGAVSCGQHAGVQTYRLHCEEFWVDVGLLKVNGRWIASADTVDGPTLGCGTDSLSAWWHALEPFDGVVGDLLASPPADPG